MAALTSTAFVGTPLARAPVTRRVRAQKATRQVVAKYDTKEGQYFDLSDLDNTVGSWDMYGADQDKNRYNGLQSEFFQRASAPLSRRGSLLAFTAGIGAAAVLVWGAKGSKDAKLPITVGPQQPAQVGPRGRI